MSNKIHWKAFIFLSFYVITIMFDFLIILCYIVYMNDEEKV